MVTVSTKLFLGYLVLIIVVAFLNVCLHSKAEADKTPDHLLEAPTNITDSGVYDFESTSQKKGLNLLTMEANQHEGHELNLMSLQREKPTAQAISNIQMRPSEGALENRSGEDEAFLDFYHNHCKAPRKGEGVILLNFLGQMANNFFELAFANRLARDLCWKILYRPGWDHELPNERAKHCLPNAFLPHNHEKLPELEPRVAHEINLTGKRWSRIVTRKNEYTNWINHMNDQGKVLEMGVLTFPSDDSAVEEVINRINRPGSAIRIASMNAFFIHYDWMKAQLKAIRQQFAFNPDCCLNTPPEDAVVFHLRDFDNPKNGGNIRNDKIYPELMQYYNWTDRPIWIVCQPKAVKSPGVHAIRNATTSRRITVVPGVDQYDAFCTLTRAKTLVGSAASSYSQMAAILMRPDGEFHIPIPRVNRPRVTMRVPGWNYHLVSMNKMQIETYNISQDLVTFKRTS